MARISLWKGSISKGNDYKFTDRIISEFFNASGTSLYIHAYMGTYDADGKPIGITGIQDVLFQENRDRRYSKEIFEIRGTYSVTESDFDLKQFGFFMSGDTMFIEVHINDMMALIGRKIMPGDVVELPHQRDDVLLNGGEAINKYYVVEDATKASDGYSATWWPHIWRIKISPMTGGQEYNDILQQNNTDPFGLGTDSTLEDVLSTLNAEQDNNNAILDEAKKHLFARNFETQQFYFVAGEETNDQLPWIWSGDGIPPNGAELLGSGNSFPDTAADGSYYLRTNYQPAQLFRKKGNSWKIQEIDYRMSKWSASHRLLDEFLNNDTDTTLRDGTVLKEKIALSKSVTLKSDF